MRVCVRRTESSVSVIEKERDKRECGLGQRQGLIQKARRRKHSEVEEIDIRD